MVCEHTIISQDLYKRNTMFKRFCAINPPTTSNYKNNIKIHLHDNFITYLALPKSIVQCICFIKWVSLASTHRLTCRSCTHTRHILVHFQDKRLYGYNAVTMATSPIFFHNHPFPSPDILSNQTNMVVLCSTVGRGYSYF